MCIAYHEHRPYEKGTIVMSALLKKFSNLLCVKSIVTLVLTVVFAYLAVLDRISNQDFLTIFSVVIAFYFGTQSQRLNEKDREGHRQEATLAITTVPLLWMRGQ